ncbi:phosphoglycerate mutase-like protein [Testicularia cyperi]|uniref:Phosphoglycerate mutase-like protein n=1 Tax=Testicularia cyperi TaxID=1882483 RepID=A0A317XVJ3_9BASI|nr:phosphoglycerate mutase-like protein [Testicularia cyperi]
MAPQSRIYLTRHSQAEHNVADDYSIPDAPLTPLGKQQSARLPSLTQDLQSRAEVILSSGLKRTLQSTKIGYAPAIERLGGLSKVVVLPQLQECNDFPCDTGSDRKVLEQDPELQGFDLSQLTPDWTSKEGFYAADYTSLSNRAKWVRQYLRSRPEKEIVVMAHGDILRRITGQSYPWKNAEVRLFQFDAESVDSDECPLVLVQNVATGGAVAEPTSGDMAVENGVPAGSNSALPSIPVSNSGSLQDLSKDPSVEAANAELKRREDRMRQRQSVLLEQTNELQELEKRLQAAEERKRQLEARGGFI